MAGVSVYDQWSFLSDVDAELQRAEAKHRPMNSLHEAYAVILEEVDELWDLARLKSEARDPAAVRMELVQIAAMAWRAARNLGLEYESPKSNQGEGGDA